MSSLVCDELPDGTLRITASYERRLDRKLVTVVLEVVELPQRWVTTRLPGSGYRRGYRARWCVRGKGSGGVLSEHITRTTALRSALEIARRLTGSSI